MSKNKRRKADEVAKVKEKLARMDERLSTWTPGTPAHTELQKRRDELSDLLFDLTKHPNQVR